MSRREKDRSDMIKLIQTDTVQFISADNIKQCLELSERSELNSKNRVEGRDEGDQQSRLDQNGVKASEKNEADESGARI